MLFIFSCTQDPLALDDNDNLIDKTEQTDNNSFKGKQGATSVDAEPEKFDIDWCLFKCSKAHKECFDWAVDNREASLNDCEDIRIIGTEMVDVYCEESVIIGYDQVEVYSPEGELIRIHEVPIYGTELVLCGQEEQNIYSNDPIILAEYDACRLAAQLEFADAIDECDLALIECEEDCRKPKPNDDGGEGGEEGEDPE